MADYTDVHIRDRAYSARSIYFNHERNVTHHLRNLYSSIY
jgi:hypothetical protein